MAQSGNKRIRSRFEFESKVFLQFALRLMYRHYERPPIIHNWIAKLSREIQTECKGRRKRIRGPLIRFGKKIIEAVFRNATALVDELRENYTNNINSSTNHRARMYGSDQYGYTERRARDALAKAVQAFKRNRPAEKLPVMRDLSDIEFENERREFEEFILNDPECAENHAEAEVSSWDTPFHRPSEEAVNALLANACDDNGYSEDEFDNPPTAKTGTESDIPDRPFQVGQSYFPGFEPIQVTTHKSGRTRSKWAHLRATPENIHS